MMDRRGFLARLAAIGVLPAVQISSIPELLPPNPERYAPEPEPRFPKGMEHGRCWIKVGKQRYELMECTLHSGLEVDPFFFESGQVVHRPQRGWTTIEAHVYLRSGHMVPRVGELTDVLVSLPEARLGFRDALLRGYRDSSTPGGIMTATFKLELTGEAMALRPRRL